MKNLNTFTLKLSLVTNKNKSGEDKVKCNECGQCHRPNTYLQLDFKCIEENCYVTLQIYEPKSMRWS